MNLDDEELKATRILNGATKPDKIENYSLNKHKYIKTPENVIKFLNEIENICKKYNFSISHEDEHGAFIIEKYEEYNIKWLKDCMLNLDEKELKNE